MSRVISLSPIVFWLLDFVRFDRRPVYFVLSTKPWLESLTNELMGEWSQHERGVMLKDILDLGLIEITKGVEYYEGELVFGLTRDGGAVWEDFALPKWDVFSYEMCPDTSTNNDHPDITMSLWHGSTLDTIMKDATERYDEYDIELMSHEMALPWGVCYWKTLSQGVIANIAKRHRGSECDRRTTRFRTLNFTWREFGFGNDSVYNCSIFPFVRSRVWPYPKGEGWNWQKHLAPGSLGGTQHGSGGTAEAR